MARKARDQEAAVCARDQASAVESREITIAANRYVDDHPEIITFATEEYHRLVASGRTATTKAKETVQHLRDLHSGRSAE